MRLHIALVALVLFATSCSYASLGGFPVSGLGEGDRFVVMHQPKDDRDIHYVLVDLLQGRGMVAQAFPLDSPDYVVTYVDRWAWDMRTYMIDFRVDVRNAETGVLVGTGRSFQTSLDAMGSSYQDVIANALDVALRGQPSSKPRR